MTYEIVNTTTANTIGAYGSEYEARVALERLWENQPSLRGEVEIVAFDDDGLAHDPGQVAQAGGSPGLVA